MDQAIRILFSHAAATPDQVKHSESQLTAFEVSVNFWDQAIQMLQSTADAQIQAYLLMAMKRKINSDTKSFTSSQKRSLLEFVKNLTPPSSIRDQLLARLYVQFWGIVGEEERKKNLLYNFSIFYYFLEEDLDARITSWLSPITKAELFPQLLSSAPNSERCGIIKLLVEKEIAALEASQVETLLGMAVQSGYPEELFDVLEILLEKHPPVTFLPFIKYFLEAEEDEVALEFILFCIEWLEYASEVELAPVYTKILRLACAHYDPADPCFSPQFLLEVSQLPGLLPLELEEAVVLSASHLLKRITECEDIEDERREGDLSIVKSALQPFAKLNYLEHFLGTGDGLMAEAIASHLPSISVFTLKSLLACDKLSLKEKLRVSNRLLRLLVQRDLEMLKDFTLSAISEQPVLCLKLLRHLDKKIKINFVEMYPLVSSMDRRVFKVYVTCLDVYNPQVLEYICQAKDVELLSGYVENLRQLPLDSLVYQVLNDATFENVHSMILEKFEADSAKRLFGVLLDNHAQSNVLLLAKLGSKNKPFQPAVLESFFSMNLNSETMKHIMPLLRNFEGNDFIDPLISLLSQNDLADPELLQSVVKLLQNKHSYNASFATQCLSLSVQDPFTDSLIGSYLYSFYLNDPNAFIQLQRQFPWLHVKPDTFKSERNFIDWWIVRKTN